MDETKKVRAIGRHGVVLRGLEDVPRSSIETGRFGRMFRNLPPAVHQVESLNKLGEAMINDETEITPEGEVDSEETTKPIPAGYTYLGQFIDHDLTFDPASSLDKHQRPRRPGGLPHSALRPRLRLRTRA